MKANLVLSHDEDWIVKPNGTALRKRLRIGKIDSLWGVAPVAPIHFGMDPVVLAQRRLIACGCRHTILIADQHAMMSHGLSFQDVLARSEYYKHYFMSNCGMEARFVYGSAFQNDRSYVNFLYSTVSSMPLSKVKDTLSRVLRGSGVDNAMVSSYLYSIMQCADACFLGSDLVFGESGQEKIYSLMEHFAENPTPTHVGSFGAMDKPDYQLFCPGGYDLLGKELSLSRSATRITIHESPESLANKMRKMFAPPHDQALQEGVVNPVLHYFRFSVFPWFDEPIVIPRRDQSELSFESYNQFESAFREGKMHPSDCKSALGSYFLRRIETVKASMGKSLCRWIDSRQIEGQNHDDRKPAQDHKSRL